MKTESSLKIIHTNLKLRMRKSNMSHELNKARQRLIDEYLKALNEDKIPWQQEWESYNKPFNAITNKNYRGMNRLLLSYVSDIFNYDDPRWLTFNQAAKNGWNIMKGSKGIPIEYWSIYDRLQKKNINIKEADEIISGNEERKNDMVWKSRVYTVFNAKQVEGILEYEKVIYKIKDPQPFIDYLIKEMKVGYEETGSRAFYNSKEDKVTIPPSISFRDTYSYHATRLHELAHATGHSSRLNRQLANAFGSAEYAKEELRAEIASSFIAGDLLLEFDEQHLKNHKAYIQSWISVLKDDPNELFRAIKDADKIYDYVIKTGKLELFQIQEEMIHEKINSNILPSQEMNDIALAIKL